MNGVHSASTVYHCYSDSVSRFVQNVSKKVHYLWRYCPFDLKSAEIFVVLLGWWEFLPFRQKKRNGEITDFVRNSTWYTFPRQAGCSFFFCCDGAQMPLPASSSFILLNILMRETLSFFSHGLFLCVLKSKVHTVTCREAQSGE